MTDMGTRHESNSGFSPTPVIDDDEDFERQELIRRMIENMSEGSPPSQPAFEVGDVGDAPSSYCHNRTDLKLTSGSDITDMAEVVAIEDVMMNDESHAMENHALEVIRMHTSARFTEGEGSSASTSTSSASAGDLVPSAAALQFFGCSSSSSSNASKTDTRLDHGKFRHFEVTIANIDKSKVMECKQIAAAAESKKIGRVEGDEDSESSPSHFVNMKLAKFMGYPSLPFRLEEISPVHYKKFLEADSILKKGISPGLSPVETIDKVVLYFSVVKGCTKLQDCTEILNRPVDVSRYVIELIGDIVGDWRNFFTKNSSLRVVRHEGLRVKLYKGPLSRSSQTKCMDMDVFTMYKPMELIGDMITFIILELIEGDFNEALRVSWRLQNVLKDNSIYQASEFKRVYEYICISMELLMKSLIFRIPKLPDAFPSDEDWSEEMLQKRFVLWHYIERNLRGCEDCIVWKSDMLKLNDIYDVEWLLAVLSCLREERLKTPFPGKVSKLEIQLVNKACSIDGENPFVILALLTNLSDRSRKVSLDFEMACGNLFSRFGFCLTFLVNIAKFFLKHKRNYGCAYVCLRRAIILCPKDAEANYLCGKYMCGSKKTAGFGSGAKDVFYAVALTSDLSNFEFIFEFFKNSLPHRAVSTEGSPLFEAIVEASTRRNRRIRSFVTTAPVNFDDAIDIILTSVYVVEWTEVQKAQLKFLSSLHKYLINEKDEALDMMLPLYNRNHIISMIRDLDELCSTYKWDKSRLSFDKYRDWILAEYHNFVSEITYSNNGGVEEGNDLSDVEDNLDDTRVIDNEDVISDEDPHREMLTYLLRVLWC